MMALTLTQPWATLVAIGAKRIETRSWSTRYRGPLAIHAAKRFPRYAREFTTEPICYEAVKSLYPWRDRLARVNSSGEAAYPLGVVLATCVLADCCRIVTREHMFNDAGSSSAYLANGEMFPPLEPELSFGNYEHGRFGFLLKDVVALPKPIPAKGALGLWEWTEEVC